MNKKLDVKEIYGVAENIQKAIINYLKDIREFSERE